MKLDGDLELGGELVELTLVLLMSPGARRLPAAGHWEGTGTDDGIQGTAKSRPPGLLALGRLVTHDNARAQVLDAKSDVHRAPPPLLEGRYGG